MAFIQQINSVAGIFRRLFLVAVIAILLGTSAAAKSQDHTEPLGPGGELPQRGPGQPQVHRPDSEQPTIDVKAQPKPDCPKAACIPRAPIFKGLNQAALNVWLPAPYQRAVDCHDRINECLTEEGLSTQLPGIQAENERRYLLEHYKTLPAPLHTDNLIRLFKAKIEKELMPHVEPDENCHIPDLRILENNKTQFLFDNTPNALTVDVSVYIFDSTRPKIAVLTIHSYRQNYASRQTFIPILAIPLDLPDSKITEILSDFVNAYHLPTNCEGEEFIRKKHHAE